MRITDTHPILMPSARPAAGGMASSALALEPPHRWQRTLVIAGVVVAVHAAALWGITHALHAQPAELPREPDVIQATLLAPPQPEPPAPIAAPAPPEPPVSSPSPASGRGVGERATPPKPQPKVVQPKPRPTPKPTPRPAPQPVPQAAAPAPEPPPPTPAPEPAVSSPSPASGRGVGERAHPLEASSAAPAAPAAAATTLPSSSAAYLNNAPPPYPPVARRLGETGKVVVRVLIGTNGRAEKAQIAQSSGYQRLDDAALETARDRWRYVPGTKNGVPTAMWFNVPINFVLE